MAEPTGVLAPAQYEIMQVVWGCGEAGATVVEVWQRVSEKREITRTTILNQVDRLEKRGWLRRHQDEGVFRYVSTIDQATATQRLAGEFVNDFFGGSASELIASLLGSRRLKAAEVARLRAMLDETRPTGRKRKSDGEANHD